MRAIPLSILRNMRHKSLCDKMAALIEGGERIWKTYQELDYDADCFEKIGYSYESTKIIGQ